MLKNYLRYKKWVYFEEKIDFSNYLPQPIALIYLERSKDNDAWKNKNYAYVWMAMRDRQRYR